uniref:target of Myb protein 1 isoform X1 n=1 Tax=Gasterosteus aculeatus aculeatus TaxID=481459 RepID=UPI001A983F74|nr:target of Myb protein 1 isoform X1 [Gasterosteus aculeatus aculeatus]
MEFLMGNPFSTPVGQRVESATGSSLPSEDWALNMEICDMINSSEEGSKDAVRALKKRIVGNRNFKEVMLALTVLETCVKNCGYKFHVLVTTRDFVEGVLVRSIIPKNNPPLILHDRVLSIVQAWADAFRSSPDLTGVVSVYEDLRRKGLEFPVTELDGYTPIQAPQKRSPGNGSSVTTLPSALLSSKPPLIPPLTSELKLALEGNNAFTSVQVKQLKTELGVVRSNLTMMSDMMTQLDPVTVKEADMELLELYTVCKEMQDRIVKVVPRLSEEKLIEELLAANDEINSAFTRYHRFERRIPNCQSAAEKSQTYVNLTDFDLTPESVSQSGFASVTNSSFSLSKADSFSSQMARLSTSESDDALPQNISTRQRPSELSEVAEDGPAEARDSRLRSAATDDSPASTRSASPKLDWMIKRGMIPINQSTVMDDIEKWLELDNEYDDFEDADGVTSEEFDKFLAGRAQAAERLPSLRASSQDAGHSQSPAAPGT